MSKAMPPGYPSAKPRRLSPATIVAILLGLVLMALLGLFVYRSFGGPEAPLPASPAQQLPPLPQAPPLPAMNQTPPPAGAPLPETNIQPAPQPSVTNVQPPPPPPQASGRITWTWALYPVDPTILTLAMGDKMAGYRFLALGVTIHNGSTSAVQVDANAFTLTVDGRTYSTEVWATGAASFVHGMPYLAEALLQPGASMSGSTGFMLPMQSTSAVPDWRPAVPATIQVVRSDPPSPQPLPPAPAPTPIE